MSLALHLLILIEAFWTLALQLTLTAVNLWTIFGLTTCLFLTTQTLPLHDLLKPPDSLTVTFLVATLGPHELLMVTCLLTATALGAHDLLTVTCLWTATALGAHDLLTVTCLWTETLGAHLWTETLGAHLWTLTLGAHDLLTVTCLWTETLGAHLWTETLGAHLWTLTLGAHLWTVALGAHLAGAHLAGAHLAGAHLAGADLAGPHLDGALLEDDEDLPLQRILGWLTAAKLRSFIFPSTDRAGPLLIAMLEMASKPIRMVKSFMNLIKNDLLLKYLP